MSEGQLTLSDILSLMQFAVFVGSAVWTVASIKATTRELQTRIGYLTDALNLLSQRVSKLESKGDSE